MTLLLQIKCTTAYFKLVRGKNEALIHLGNEDNEWVRIFRDAIARRQQLDNLIAQRTRLYAEIAKLEAALAPAPNV